MFPNNLNLNNKKIYDALTKSLKPLHKTNVVKMTENFVSSLTSVLKY